MQATMRKATLFRSMLLAGLAAATFVAACAGTTDTPSRQFVTVTLNATPQSSGQIGRAFLMPEGEVTRVQIEVSGVPPLISSRPVHLYTFLYEGPCERLGEKPAYALLDRVLARSPSSAGMVPMAGPFTVSNTAPLPLAKLRAGSYAIVVKTSPADGDREIFCGEVW